jgi:CheY-like chemotaxis protein
MARSTVRVFVLDDEPNVAETWALIMKKAGYEVSLFTNPHEALDAIRKQPPHVLLSDVGMIGMNGIEIAIALLKEKIPTKVILISGRTTTGDHLKNAAEQGYFFEVLPKPVGAEKFM